MKRVCIIGLDPGTANLGLAGRTYELRNGALGTVLDTWNMRISAKTPVAAAQMVVMALRPLKHLKLIICEDFAYMLVYQAQTLGRLVGAIEFWAAKHHIAFVRVPISRAKMGLGLKGNCNRKVYVAELRKRYPRAASDDSRVALAVLDICAVDCWSKANGTVQN